MPHVNDANSSGDLERQASLLRALEENAQRLNEVMEDRIDLVVAGRSYGLSWHQIGQALGNKTGRYIAEKYRQHMP